MGLPADHLLAPHFRAREFAVSASRPDLVTRPDDWTPAEVDAIAYVAAWLSRVRGILGGHPIEITSGLRRGALNAAVGGSARSWHLDGRAVDWRPPGGMTSLDVLAILWDQGVPVDLAIAYHPSRGGHLHTQIDGALRPRNRRMVAHADGGYQTITSRRRLDELAGAWS